MAFVALAVVIVVAVAVVALGGGGSSPRSAATTNATASTTKGGGNATVPATSASVAVLNGTDIVDLAAKVSTQLTDDGFHHGAVADAPNQATPTTTVGYSTGYRSAAVKVAHALALAKSSVVPVSAANEAAARVGGQTPQIVVTLGANYPQ